MPTPNGGQLQGDCPYPNHPAIQQCPFATPRKVIKNHRAFPTDDSALKVVYLAMHNIAKKWTMPISNWKPALNRFAILYEERFPL